MPSHEFWEPSGLRKFIGDETETFTVVINSFNRHDMLMDALEHYSRCEYVKYVHVTWCEKEMPPLYMTNRFNAQSNPMVNFDIYEDSLNARFMPLKPGTYNDGIFSVDDDIRVSCHELKLAHEVWRGSSHTLVGFMPRLHVPSKTTIGEYIYRCWYTILICI